MTRESLQGTPPASCGECPPYTRLYLASKKLRGLAYLIECQGKPSGVHEDASDINWGISLVLEDLAKDLSVIAEAVENEE